MLRQLTIATLVAGLGIPSTIDASEFSDLSKSLPANANTVLLVDVSGVLSTDMAKQNGWGDPSKAANRPVYLPPEADKVIVTALVDPLNGFRQLWEAAVIGLNESLPMRLVARAEGGYVDAINGTEVAWVPSDAYFIDFDPKVLGLIHPANRQAASRWIESNKSAGGKRGPSEYLQSAVLRASEGAHIVLALDAKDAMPPHRLAENLGESETVEKHKLNVDKMTDVFASLLGITLNITITDKASGEIQVEFGEDVPFSREVGKDFLLGALSQLEASIPGLEDWSFSVSSNSIFARGELETAALRRVLSVLEIPTTKFSSLKDEDTEAEPEQSEVGKKSLAYYHSIDTLVDDLRGELRKARGTTYWFDKYAKKIDRLPILNVDADLLDFGQKTSETLRVMSGSKKAANVSQSVSSAAVTAGNYNNNGYSGYNRNYRGSGYRSGRSVNASNQANKRANRASIQSTATNKKNEGFRLIEDASFEIRRVMTERYMIEF